MVLALILVGGTHENKEAESQLAQATIQPTPGGSRILRDPSLLYVVGDQRVSYMTALEFIDDTLEEPDTEPVSEVAAEVATPPPDPTEAVAPSQAPVPTKAPATAPARAVAPAQAPQAAAPSTAGATISGHATSYGPGYNGQSMGCGGVYSSSDMSIMAVSPARYREWPCGTQVQVCGPAGCIVATRQDACPGCYANLVDLSEAGNAAVCGSPPSTCRVTLQLVGTP